MNTDAIKKRLASLTEKTQKAQRPKVDYEKLYFKPKPSDGEQVIRLLPNKFNDEIPFQEVAFYFNFGGRIISPSTFGEADPIENFIIELRKSGNSDNIKLAKQLEAKQRIFAQVVVRGKENEGPKLWEFGKTVFQDLLAIMADPDYGDITDIDNGMDIKVKVISAEASGKKYPTTTIRVKPKSEPVYHDSKVVEALIENQSDVVSLYKRYTEDELKETLNKFITNMSNPSNEEAQENTSPGTSYSGKPKSDINSKLDALFN